MSRRITITILACLAVLWSAAAPAQDKINPNQVPNKVTPPPVISNPVIKPPADPTGGGVGERERQALEALRDAEAAGKLEKELGLDAAMGAGPGDDRPGFGKFDKGDETFMQRFCKTKASRLFPGMCPRSDPGGDPSDFYDTKSSTKPGAGTPFDVPTAASGVPSRGDQASDDPPKPDDSWTDSDGTKHDIWFHSEVSATGNLYSFSREAVRHAGVDHDIYRVVSSDNNPGAEGGDNVVMVEDVYLAGDSSHNVSHMVFRCRGGSCTPDRQPDERGPQGKARAWFCAQTPEAAGCKPVKSGFEIDPAHPDGEGTPTGTRTTDGAPKVGRGAVSDPGPADSDIRGTTGGGSRPLDMKDPVNPDGPVKPDGRK